MRKFTLLCGILCGFGLLQGQDTLTIQQIQNVPAVDLANCLDTTLYLNDTVVTFGTVVMDGGLAQVVSGRNLWIQNGTGPFSGLDLFTTGVPTPVAGTDVLDLVAGDSIMVRGVILRFPNNIGSETEIAPLEITLIAAGRPVHTNSIGAGELNDDMRVNIPTTGEQWEGAYVELTNVTVSSVSPFSGGSRVSFNVQDAAGNTVNISDRFLVQRLPANGGTFVAPNVGTVYDTLRGVVAHSANGCFGANGRGYEIHPFQESDYVVAAGTAPPLISAITYNPGVPNSGADVNVSATIEDVDGTVDTASLYYAVGVNNPNFLKVPMTGVGTTYTGTIPSTAFSDGDFVKFYICATDNDMLTACSPDVPGSGDPRFFTVRDNGLTIYDVQFTPYANGNSGYLGQDVTVTGIVTASASSDDLGFVYIQQRGSTEWGGLSVVQNADLNSLLRGDSVTVTGTVQESFGFTQMVVQSVTNHGATSPVEALSVDPNVFSTYDFATNERYEGMLLKLIGPGGGEIYIVDENADDPNNFAEYRIGSDGFDPNSGSRVLAGRVTGSAFSSLSFSFINDSMWIANSGIINPNIPICVVTPGDTMASLTGIMYYGFSNMKLLPRNNDDAENARGANCPNGVTGIIDPLAGTQLRVYPNPTANQLTIDFAFPRAVQAKAQLVDLMGRPVAEVALSGLAGIKVLDTQSLSTGTYVLMVKADQQWVAQERILIVK